MRTHTHMRTHMHTHTHRYLNVVGDSLLSSGVIAYLGAFTSAFRTASVDSWKALLTEKEISRTEVSDGCGLIGVSE